MRYYTLFLLAAILMLAIFSWLASMYGWIVHNVLSADGLRWAAASVLGNFRQVPFAEMLMVLVALSFLTESGLLKAFHVGITLKQRRALQFSVLVLIISLVAIAAAVFMPSSVLLSSFGRFAGSPIAAGLPALMLLVVVLVSITFGFLSGRFLTASDMLSAAAHIPAAAARVLPVLFLTSQLIGCYAYIFTTPPAIVSILLYVAPVVVAIIK